MVVAPVVKHLAGAGSRSTVAPDVTIASMELAAASELAAGVARATPMELDVTDAAALDAAVKAHDLVISLVPAPFHVVIAEACIKNVTNMLTTSYVSPEMQALDERATSVSTISKSRMPITFVPCTLLRRCTSYMYYYITNYLSN